MRRALVLGDASCVHADAEAALKLFRPDAVFATNNIGIVWPHVDFWCTLHPAPCYDWVGMTAALAERIAAGRNEPEIWSHQTKKPGIPNRSSDWGGSTGLLAVKVALEKRFDRIVLAGVPMTVDGGHFYDSKPWSSAGRFRRAWSMRVNMLRGRVKSMSGWTRDLLGAPDAAWLAEPAETTTD